MEAYLGLLYTMDDVAVYGYITASKVKIILALSLSDTVVKDVEVVNVSAPNPFLPLQHPRSPQLAHCLPRTLTLNPPWPVDESIPYGIPVCGREPLPQITRAVRRSQRSRELASGRRREVEELSKRCG